MLWPQRSQRVPRAKTLSTSCRYQAVGLTYQKPGAPPRVIYNTQHGATADYFLALNLPAPEQGLAVNRG